MVIDVPNKKWKMYKDCSLDLISHKIDLINHGAKKTESIHNWLNKDYANSYIYEQTKKDLWSFNVVYIKAWQNNLKKSQAFLKNMASGKSQQY